MNIGKSVAIKGDLVGSEDLTVDGQVDGTIQLSGRILTIGLDARVSAEVFAGSIIVNGHVVGRLTATERVDIQGSGSVEGDIVSPRVSIAESAHFRGTVDMQRK